MDNKRELTKSQVYAVKAANVKLVLARRELQNVLDNIGEELGITPSDGDWGISADMRYLEWRDIPPVVKNTFPSGKTKSERKESKGGA